jgi:hypothetical protein
MDGVTMSKLSEQVNYWLNQYLDPIPDDSLINVYFAGQMGTGDERLYETLNIPYLAKPTAIKLDPWIIRVRKGYHWDKFHVNVTPCQPVNHQLYQPDALKDLRRGLPITPSTQAKLLSGYHCATADVVELYNFMKQHHYFDPDFD